MGFSIILYTPTTWLRAEAARAAKEYRRLEPNQVGDAYREAVLRVIVNPDTPTIVTGSGMVGASSVQHVVLRDEGQKIVIQPVFKEALVQEVSNAMGGKATFQGLLAKFPLDALPEIRGRNGDEEFYVTVVGSTGEEKNFKVKRKHFDRIP